MKRSLLIVLATTILFLDGFHVLAADTTPTPAVAHSPNAALVYWRAFSVIPELTKDEEAVMAPYAKPLPANATDVAAKWGPALQLMYEATAIPDCWWGVDYAKEGTGAVLSYLANARKLSRGACFHARYLASKGDMAGASKDLESAVILARQVGGENLISTLVEVAIEKIATDATASCMTDAKNAAALSGMVDRFASALPAHLAKTALLGEEPTFKLAFTSDVERHAAAGTLPEFLASMQLPAGTDEKTLLSWVADTKDRYAQAAEIVDLPGLQFEKRFETFSAEMKSSSNPLLKLDDYSILTAIPKIRAYEMELKARWTMLHAGAAFLTGGQVAFDAIRDPFGDGPFAKTSLDGGFVLASKLLVDSAPVMLKFGAAR